MPGVVIVLKSVFSNLLALSLTRLLSSSRGKDADVYQVTPQVAIVTGHRPFGFLNADEESCELCETLARRIENDHDMMFDLKIKKMHKLMEEFAEHILMKVRRIGERDEGKREGGLYQYI